MLSEEQAAALAAKVAGTGDLLLQAWRIGDTDLEHVQFTSRDGSRDEDPLSPRTVLDLGCGMGQYLHLYKQVHPNALCVGVNLYDSQLKYCHSDIATIVADIRDPDLKLPVEGRYSQVFCHYTAGYLTYDELDMLCKKVVGLLAPNGFFSLWDITARSTAITDIFDYHLHETSKVIASLVRAGFNEVGLRLPGDDGSPKVRMAENFRKVSGQPEIEAFLKYTLPVFYWARKGA